MKHNETEGEVEKLIRHLTVDSSRQCQRGIGRATLPGDWVRPIGFLNRHNDRLNKILTTVFLTSEQS
jgi:hypothetical protein